MINFLQLLCRWSFDLNFISSQVQGDQKIEQCMNMAITQSNKGQNFDEF